MKLYVHIPFCHSKCAYCDFYSTPRKDWMEAYVDALAGEWEQRRKGLKEPIDTLYLGGGSPSSLPTGLLKRIIETLTSDNSSINTYTNNPPHLREATIEANPEDVTKEWVDFIVNETPFRRVSMGIQSFSDEELALIGRRHSAQKAIEAIGRLREGGIGNISCDLIYGLPGQSLESWKKSLDTLIAVRPEHISAYLLSYEPGTRLSVMLEKGKIHETDEAIIDDMYAFLCETTRKAGYIHYEISNFALPGREAIHNSSYWDGSPYIGLGPGAHSCDGVSRSFIPPSLKNYIACKGKDFGIIDEENELNRYNDMLITRLRTLRGLRPSSVKQEFGGEIYESFVNEASALEKKGLLKLSPEGAYIIPEKMWLTSNSILLELIKI